MFTAFAFTVLGLGILYLELNTYPNTRTTSVRRANWPGAKAIIVWALHALLKPCHVRANLHDCC